ncbi:MAG: hypothetical protein R3B47_18210 [Bacteroidia bacterium]
MIPGTFCQNLLDGQHFEIGEKIVRVKKRKHLILQEKDGDQSIWLPSDREMLNQLRAKFEAWNN